MASAWTHFVEVEKKFKVGDSRIKFAHDHAAALEKRIPRITVKLEPGSDATTKVFRDDVELGAASLGVALPVDPGAHVIKTVSARGEEETFPISVSEGTSTDVVVRAAAGTAPPPPPPLAAANPAPPPQTRPAESATEAKEQRSNGNRSLGYALLAGGGIGVALGVASGVVALSKANEVKDVCGPDYLTCNQASVDAASSGRTLTTVSTVGFVVGSALVAVGVYFAFFAPDRSRAEAEGVSPFPRAEMRSTRRSTATRAWRLDVGSLRGTF